MTQVHSTRSRGRRGAARAFSLVEMMIALVILAFGLLIVGAALPIGIDYTRRTAEKSIGEAATEYALDVIESRIRLSENSVPAPIPPGVPGEFLIRDNLFRPREINGTLSPLPFPVVGPGSPRYPFFKVRPMPLSNVDAWGVYAQADFLDNNGELIIYNWLNTFIPGRLGATPPEQMREVAVIHAPPNARPQPPNPPPYETVRVAISAVSRVFPPITADFDMTPPLFVSAPYVRRPVATQDPTGVLLGDESLKAAERLIAWTALYRRASYSDSSNTALYEVIVIAARRPSHDYRFAQQDLASPAAFSTPVARPVSLGARGTAEPDRVAPVPWLISFTSVPFPDAPPLSIYNHDPVNNPNRLLGVDPASPNEPSELEFTCTIEAGTLLPAGSIFIPAANDAFPSNVAPITGGRVGFVPHAPDVTAVYEVTERIREGSQYRIRVKNNGMYPWVDPVLPGPGTREDYWPVWVVPPARTGTANLPREFDQRNPIVGWSSRYMRFPEVP